MRAITVNEYGAAPALTEVPGPQPGPGQVLITVEAAGMNPVDRTIADGGLKDMMPATFPLILGADLAGVIEAVGEGASKFSQGDEVFGQLMIAPLGSAGTYAEHVAVSEDAPLVRVPKGLDPTVAAALPGAGGTGLASSNRSSRLAARPCCSWAPPAASAPSQPSSPRTRARA